jgi:hypothetical protein
VDPEYSIKQKAPPHEAGAREGKIIWTRAGIVHSWLPELSAPSQNLNLPNLSDSHQRWRFGFRSERESDEFNGAGRLTARNVVVWI